MLILRARSGILKFPAGDGITVDPAGNIKITEQVTVEGKTQEQILAMVSPADFLVVYQEIGVTVEEPPDKKADGPTQS